MINFLRTRVWQQQKGPHLAHEVRQPGALVAQQLLALGAGGRARRVLDQHHRQLRCLGPTVLADRLPQRTRPPLHVLICHP